MKADINFNNIRGGVVDPYAALLDATSGRGAIASALNARDTKRDRDEQTRRWEEEQAIRKAVEGRAKAEQMAKGFNWAGLVDQVEQTRTMPMTREVQPPLPVETPQEQIPLRQSNVPTTLAPSRVMEPKPISTIVPEDLSTSNEAQIEKDKNTMDTLNKAGYNNLRDILGIPGTTPPPTSSTIQTKSAIPDPAGLDKLMTERRAEPVPEEIQRNSTVPLDKEILTELFSTQSKRLAQDVPSQTPTTPSDTQKKSKLPDQIASIVTKDSILQAPNISENPTTPKEIKKVFETRVVETPAQQQQTISKLVMADPLKIQTEFTKQFKEQYGREPSSVEKAALGNRAKTIYDDMYKQAQEDRKIEVQERQAKALENYHKSMADAAKISKSAAITKAQLAAQKDAKTQIKGHIDAYNKVKGEYLSLNPGSIDEPRGIFYLNNLELLGVPPSAAQALISSANVRGEGLTNWGVGLNADNVNSALSLNVLDPLSNRTIPIGDALEQAYTGGYKLVLNDSGQIELLVENKK